jgi:hypothetical protein
VSHRDEIERPMLLGQAEDILDLVIVESPDGNRP